MSIKNGVEGRLSDTNGFGAPLMAPNKADIGLGGVYSNSNKASIYSKMSAVMKEIGAIGKDQKNEMQGFKFRGIDQFVNALYPALTKHGVFMAPRGISYTQELREVTRSNGKAGVDKHVSIQMEYVFWAEDGSSVTIGPVPAEGLDSGDKATNKALSAALKYALIQTFSIPTEDMAEADSESPEIVAAPVRDTSKATKQAATVGSGAESARKLAIAKAQVAVAKKTVTKKELLDRCGGNHESVTDAINSLTEERLTETLTYLEGKINGK